MCIGGHVRRRALTIHPLTGCPLLAVAAYWLIYRAEEHQVRTRDLQRVGLNSKQGGLDSAAKVAPLHSATTKINTWWEVVLAKASEELGLLVIDDTNLRRRYPNFPLLSDLRDKMLAQQEPSTKELDPFRLKYISNVTAIRSGTGTLRAWGHPTGSVSILMWCNRSPASNCSGSSLFGSRPSTTNPKSITRFAA